MFYGLQKEMGILQLCCCVQKRVSIHQSKSLELKSYKCTDIVIKNERKLEVSSNNLNSVEELKSVSCTDKVIENRIELKVSSNNLNSLEELRSVSCTNIVTEISAESEVPSINVSSIELKSVSCTDTVIENEVESEVSSVNVNSIELKSVSCTDTVIENEVESEVSSVNVNSIELKSVSCTDTVIENEVESEVSSVNVNSIELKSVSCTDTVIENEVESEEPFKRSDVMIEKKTELEDIKDKADFMKIFVVRFYEGQLSITNEIKSLIDKHQWDISIYNKKTPYETSSEYYFVNSFMCSGLKLRWLSVHKNVLSIEEKNLIIKSSENVSFVSFHCPCRIENWKPKDNIEELRILMSFYYISKKHFEECFLPWLLVCKRLYLDLHRGIDFLTQIYEWICFTNIKEFSIVFRGRCYQDLDELKYFLK
ncbi:uncharacterized protein LOC136089260 isoform X2 [Hydra vulgaris]|uniref:Uncharacterized protein LOC136089260 isoform X2 n=1 Tax=Hydra vulgaris TaxID=6087 RepID=A0ABM4D9Z9_HYDVU